MDGVLGPEEATERGLWEVEPLYYSDGRESRPPRRGKVYRCRESGAYVCFEGHDGVVYRLGDCVFLDSNQPDLPYFICGIQNFKMVKRDQLSIKVSWYYRHTEVPETVYHSLIQDRQVEGCEQQLLQSLRCRELFISDAHATHPVATLRGKCVIRHVKDVEALRDFSSQPDTFFYILSYNPENNRLASIQGEIRIGGSHQARLPALRSTMTPDDADRDSPVWIPGRMRDSDLTMFLRAARSMAAFAGICAGSQDDGIRLAANDRTTIDAYDSLHGNAYRTGDSLNHLIDARRQKLKGATGLNDEETKKFIKGLKQWGKNFFRIRKELLPNKTTAELIDFYYLWKKSAAVAQRSKGAGRVRRMPAAGLRRPKTAGTPKPSRPVSSEFLDLSSASECEEDNPDNGYACHHCYATKSRDWHHAGRDRALLCTECRIFFKKYGLLRPVDRPSTVPPYLFKSMALDQQEEGGVRTRAGGKKERKRTPSADLDNPATPSDIDRVRISHRKTLIGVLPKRKRPASTSLKNDESPNEKKSDPDSEDAPESPKENIVKLEQVKIEHVCNGLDKEATGHESAPSPDPDAEISDTIERNKESTLLVRVWRRPTKNPGEYNSCARTDIVYRMQPESEGRRRIETKERLPPALRPPTAASSSSSSTAPPLLKKEMPEMIDSRIREGQVLTAESPAARQRQAELHFIQQQMTAAFMMEQMEQQRKHLELQQMRQQQMDKSMQAPNPFMLQQHFANAAAQQQMHDPGLLALLAHDRQAAERYHIVEMMMAQMNAAQTAAAVAAHHPQMHTPTSVAAAAAAAAGQQQQQEVMHMQQMLAAAAAAGRPLLEPLLGFLPAPGLGHFPQLGGGGGGGGDLQERLRLDQMRQMMEHGRFMAAAHPSHAAAAAAAHTSEMMRRLQHEGGGHNGFPPSLRPP